MEEDPINNFFTAKEVEDPKILYTTLAIPSTATSEEIRKAYRKLALKYHPDKHTTKNGTEKEALGKVFQRVGFAYAVLSDEAKRKRYDFLLCRVILDEMIWMLMIGMMLREERMINSWMLRRWGGMRISGLCSRGWMGRC